ncbi:MAG: hypothetical protein RSG77_20890 [Hafnia sp.]
MTDLASKQFLNPIGMVCQWAPPDTSTRAVPIYFYPESVDGPGLGNTIPELINAMGETHLAIKAAMQDRQFFMSVCPEELPRYGRSTAGRELLLPDFQEICVHIEQLVATYGINEPCHLEIRINNVQTQFSVSLRVSRAKRDGGYEGLSRKTLQNAIILLDRNHPVMAQLLAWYSSCHGIIAWDFNPASINHHTVNAEDPFTLTFCEIPPDHGVYEQLRRQRYAVQSRMSMLLTVGGDIATIANN